MEGQTLPELFVKALKDEFQERLDLLDRRFEEDVNALIANRRAEADSGIQKLQALDAQRRAELSQMQRRVLRDIDSEKRHSLLGLHMAKIEIAISKELNRFRHSPDYKSFLSSAVQDAAKTIGNPRNFDCEKLEEPLLRCLFHDIPVHLGNLSNWGGFVMTSEGGVILDCSFRTRWENLRAELVLRYF